MSLASIVRKTGLGKVIKKIPFLERTAGLIYYGVFKRPYFKTCVEINIGGIAPTLLDYRFGHYNYENFGTAHNGCFRKWIELCAGKTVVFDVGAHIGLYSLVVSRGLKAGGILYAFEPSTPNQGCLERHIRYNHIKTIEVCPYLVGAEDGKEVPFFESTDIDAMNTAAPVKDPKKYQKIMRTQITLDGFCERKGVVPEIIKIDVEGTEINVFRGAERILRAHRPSIVLSVHPSHLPALGQSVECLRDLILDTGYEIYDAEGRHTNNLVFGEYLLLARK